MASTSPQLPQTIRAVRDSSAPYPHIRTLVICLDGTGDKFDNDNSNVVNFVACLKKDDPSQVTYVESGIGTYDGHGLKGGISAAVDMAVGSGLGIHIKDAYRFLMQTYREGDRICLLGFSRGSYTVRCLAGMLHKVGLLPKHNMAQVNFAYNFYKNNSPEGWAMSGEFKRTFCIDVNVYFVGVWDCVASVGFIPRKLPFGKSPTNSICYFRHAIALDEHRAKFKVCHYVHANPNDAQKTQPVGEKLRQETDQDVGRLYRLFSSCFGMKPTPGVDDDEEETARKRSGSNAGSKKKKEKEKEKDVDQEDLEQEFEKADQASSSHGHTTDSKEVWFAGCHADVGGGAVPNGERHMLSRIPLRWMLRQSFECNSGILFNTAALAETGIDVPTLWPVYQTPTKPVLGPSPRTVSAFESGALPPLSRRSTALGVDAKRTNASINGKEGAKEGGGEEGGGESTFDLLPEQVEDYFDALAPMNDQLVMAKGWWVLEFWPVKVRVQRKGSEEWRKVVRMNMGRFRAVRELEPSMHWTVEKRIEELKGAYRVRNVVDKETRWVVAV
ncbi:uncharacterized protein L3040_005205 [Drepanopeziza brunnea f. sp. 'multigermtubi']|uniref:uncharacterized protein n=1 Tax=Drepanopeziza brunnea f. sp. 'multigermtubi' TaxID=698441 RepID=UPI0023A74C73|nr:hypothetical protein L3040_005205 [Drepanopeziza brunnea f. sp. 'multigermtubi']